MELKEYIGPLLKWWWLLLGATLIAGASSYYATRQQQPLYRSTATVMIGSAIEDPNPSTSDLTITESLASTYVDFANRASVRSAVREALGLQNLPGIVVQQVNSTNFIDIMVTDTSPERAQAVAAELARQLILRSPTAEDNNKRQEFARNQLDSYEAAITETEDQIAAKREELGTLVSALEIAEAQTELASLESSLLTLRTNYTSLLASTQEGAKNAIRVIEPASMPQAPVDPQNTITILVASAVGFVLACTAAYLLEYLDDTVRTPEQITKLGNLPTLTGIAFIDSEDDSKLITVTDPRSPTSEAYRVLRTAIQFSVSDKKNSLLLLTSGVSAEGKSTTAGNLAVVLAQAGHNVLLVDGDLRRPSQHSIFNLPNKRGVTSLLLKLNADDADTEVRNLVEDTVQPTQVEGLQVMTCGPIPPNPSELLGSTKMRRLLDVLDQQYDFVIIDSPPVLSVTDAAVLGAMSGTTLVVVRANKSRKNQFKQVVERLEDVNANVAGVVLNSLKAGSEGHNFYYYYKDPYYTHGDDGGKGDPQPKSKLRKRFLRSQEAVQS
ncbi:MAG: polysaccharide biosynthesis tyrosine autokinase [Anaerolineaceae bacterium]|nr:polysaccharide biosynthesis tyrosine autokinase [Anaerolineaceae bacterium]